MHHQLNSQDPRLAPLEQTVERLTSEIAALKLELATLHSALRELQQQPESSARRAPLPFAPRIEPPARPSIAPAAIVVLLASSLLSWQLITTPRAERVETRSNEDATQAKVQPPVPALIAVETPAPPPPAAPPVVAPTVYRGTLAVKADRPGATVFVNRRAVGTAPVRVRNLRAGAHLVWVESDGYRRWTRVVTVPAEHVTRVSADLEPITENNH